MIDYVCYLQFPRARLCCVLFAFPKSSPLLCVICFSQELAVVVCYLLFPRAIPKHVLFQELKNFFFVCFCCSKAFLD